MQAKNGKAKIYWPRELSMDRVKSFNIINIAFYDDGSEVQTKFLTKSGKVNEKGNNWEGEIKVIFSPIRHEHLYFWLQQAVHVMFLRSFLCYILVG